jgi:hypothetical protein
MDNEMDIYETGKDINRYSNPSMVQKLAHKLLGKEARIIISPRKDKKYRIYNPNTEKYVDFGQMMYEDFTKHKDEDRRRRFRTRNARWANSPKYSASWLSYYLLW